MTHLFSRFVRQPKVHLIHLFGVSLALLLATGAMAQSSGFEDCQTRFSELRWTVSEPDSSWQLASDHAGATLLGAVCDPDFIKSWFASAGWTLTLDYRNEAEEFGPYGPTEAPFWMDRHLKFCLPREWPWRWLTQGCTMSMGISMFQDRITHLNAGALE